MRSNHIPLLAVLMFSYLGAMDDSDENADILSEPVMNRRSVHINPDEMGCALDGPSTQISMLAAKIEEFDRSIGLYDDHLAAIEKQVQALPARKKKEPDLVTRQRKIIEDLLALTNAQSLLLGSCRKELRFQLLDKQL